MDQNQLFHNLRELTEGAQKLNLFIKCFWDQDKLKYEVYNHTDCISEPHDFAGTCAFLSGYARGAEMASALNPMGSRIGD